MNINYTSTNFGDSSPIVTLLRFVIPYVPKVPQAMALDLLRQKYIDFCRRTRILGYEVVKNYQSGVTDYYLDAPKDHNIYSIIGIEAGRYGYYWYGYERLEYKSNFDVVDNNCIRLREVPAVDQRNGLKVAVTLLPDDCIDYMPNSIVSPFGRDIAKGVISDCLCIPNKDWTDINLSRKYELAYERMLLSARALATSNRKVGNNDIKPIRIL